MEARTGQDTKHLSLNTLGILRELRPWICYTNLSLSIVFITALENKDELLYDADGVGSSLLHLAVSSHSPQVCARAYYHDYLSFSL